MITVFTVGEEKNEYFLNLSQYQNLQFIYFPILKNRDAYLSEAIGLMHSLACTYGVYVSHAFSQLREFDTSDLFLLNPVMEMNQLQKFLLLDHVSKLKSDHPVFIISTNRIVLGLYIPSNLVRFPISFRFLTFTNFALDYQLVCKEWKDTKLDIFKIVLNKQIQDEYLHRLDQSITELQALHYLQAYRNNNNNEPYIIAITPYHAGDILFCSMGIIDPNSQISHIGVNKYYGDVAKKILPKERVVVFDCDPLQRGKNLDPEDTKHQNDELLYFYDEIYPLIDSKIAFFYMRNWRHQDKCDFHLIDQFRFSCAIQKRTLVHQKQEKIAKKLPVRKSILLHFDAGWNLKIYPHNFQLQLIEMLKKSNYYITVLTDTKHELNVDAHIGFTNVDDLEHLIKKHSIILAMDSFPGHYAAHCLQHPTIMLFSSTKLQNADQASSPIYKSLQKGLGCNPCRQPDTCPIFNLDSCNNFSSPDVVFKEIDQMYALNYEGNL